MSSDNYYYFHNVFKRYTYPTGEVHVELLEKTFPRPNPIIEVHCKNIEDLFALAMAAELVESVGASFFMPYLPFARHDHRRNNFDGYPLILVKELLSSVDLVIVDPHSDVTANDYNHIAQKHVVDFFRSRLHLNPIFLIPDTGATKKAHTWLREGDDYIQGYKKRDRSTGKLSGFGIIQEGIPEDISDRTIVIVDDICDGGGTFLGLVESLEKMYPINRIELWVTHGMFQMSKVDTLAEGFDRIASFVNNHNHSLMDNLKFTLFKFKDFLSEN